MVVKSQAGKRRVAGKRLAKVGLSNASRKLKEQNRMFDNTIDDRDNLRRDRKKLISR